MKVSQVRHRITSNALARDARLWPIPIFRSVHEFSGGALTGAALQRYRTGSQLVAVAVNLGLNLWLIPHHGWRGAARASVVTNGLLARMNWSMLQLFVSRAQEVTLSSTLNA